jgi:serine/threonine protein kinase
VTELDFELRFEVIREKKETGDKGKDVLGRPKGLRFDRDGCSSEIYSSNEKEILEWRNFLRGKINQRGFHELFRAQRKIGKGNFASVYLAERLEDEKLFAVKAFSKEAAYNQEKGKEALITEIQLMRELDHGNIMKLHEVFETENSLYFILDLLEGG